MNAEDEQELLQQELRSQRAEDRRLEAMVEEERSQGQQNMLPSSRGAGQGGSRLVDEVGHELPAEAESAAALADLEDGMSSRAFTPADAGELAAITETNKVFDRWLRNIMSAESALLPAPSRPILKNGR